MKKFFETSFFSAKIVGVLEFCVKVLLVVGTIFINIVYFVPKYRKGFKLVFGQKRYKRTFCYLIAFIFLCSIILMEFIYCGDRYLLLNNAELGGNEFWLMEVLLKISFLWVLVSIYCLFCSLLIIHVFVYVFYCEIKSFSITGKTLISEHNSIHNTTPKLTRFMFDWVDSVEFDDERSAIHSTFHMLKIHTINVLKLFPWVFGLFCFVFRFVFGQKFISAGIFVAIFVYSYFGIMFSYDLNLPIFWLQTIIVVVVGILVGLCFSSLVCLFKCSPKKIVFLKYEDVSDA